MDYEQGIFSVTSEALSRTKQQGALGEVALSSRDVWMLLEEAQPELKDYIVENVAGGSLDPLAYGAAVVSTFPTVNNQLQLNGETPIITRDDIDLHDYNLADLAVFEEPAHGAEQTSDDYSGIYEEEGINAFLNELATSSPEFAQQIFDRLVAECFTREEEKSFLRGVYDVFMPFYKKREAELMYDRLVWFPDLLEAVDEGYYTYDIALLETDEAQRAVISGL